MPDAHEFVIEVHRSERIIEVIYPAEPTWESTQSYGERIRAAITELGAPWRCLVDQRQAQVFEESLAELVSELNVFARAHGMERSARVLPIRYMSRLQAERIADHAGVASAVNLFYSREEAWLWLTDQAQMAAG